MAIVIHGTNGISSDDNVKAQFGDGNDLQIYHNGSHSYIDDAGTGRLYIRANDHITFQNAAGTETYANFASNGAVGLRYDNTTKIVTTSEGVAIGAASTTDGAALDIRPSTNIAQIKLTQNNVGDGGDGWKIHADGPTGGGLKFLREASNTDTEYFKIDQNGDADFSGELIADSYNEKYNAVSSSSNATTVNCESGNSFSHTLTENTTFTFSNPPSSGTAYSFSIEIIQDSGASGYTVTWPTSVDWPAATAPTLTATASAKDVFVFYTRDGGTNWYGFTAGQALG